MADYVVLNRTNTELFAANIRKKQGVQRIGFQNDSQGACILNIEDVEKRKQLAKN